MASAADLAVDEHPTVLHEAGEIGPELVVGDALLDTLVLADELEEDESAKEVQDEANEEAVKNWGAKKVARMREGHSGVNKGKGGAGRRKEGVG